MERRDLRQKMLEIRKSLPSNVVKKVSKEICDVVKNLDSFKNAKKISSEQLCLPLYPGLKNSEIKYVVQSLKKTLNEFI